MMGMLAENPQESFHEQALIAIDKDSQVAKKVNVALIEFADKNPWKSHYQDLFTVNVDLNQESWTILEVLSKFFAS